MTANNYLKEKTLAMEILHNVIDPELFVNIVDLGLIYKLDFNEENKIIVNMTLSTPYCPMGESIVHGVEHVLSNEFPGREVNIELVWEPEWTIDKISEEGKRQLGIIQ